MFMPLEWVKYNLRIRQDEFGRSPDDVAFISAALRSHPAGAIKLRYFNHGWLPIWEDGGGNFVGLDLDPGPSGRYGQVISYGRDIHDMAVLADSLWDFLRVIQHVLAQRDLGCRYKPAFAPRSNTQVSPVVSGWVSAGLWDWREHCEHR